MTFLKPHRLAGGGMIALMMLTGCQHKELDALDRAKSRAVQTNTPWQVQFIDRNGDTVTDLVLPPATPTQQPLVTIRIEPPPPGIKPTETEPVVTPAKQ